MLNSGKNPPRRSKSFHADTNSKHITAVHRSNSADTLKKARKRKKSLLTNIKQIFTSASVSESDDPESSPHSIRQRRLTLRARQTQPSPTKIQDGIGASELQKSTPINGQFESIANCQPLFVRNSPRTNSPRRKPPRTPTIVDSNTDPLFAAVISGSAQLVEQLLQDCHHDVNKMNKSKSTLLHVAAVNNKVEVMKVLIQMGADIEALNKNRSTPLHMAASAGAREAVQLLISSRANMNQRDMYGYTAFHLAVKSDKFQIAEDLLLYGAKVDFKKFDGKTAMHICCEEDNLEGLKFLLANNAQPNVRDDKGNTPLLACVESGSLYCFEHLLKVEGINLTLKNNRGANILHRIVKEGQIAMAIVLYDNHAKEVEKSLLNDQDSRLKHTPLHYAVKAKDDSMVGLLLLIGANPNIQDINGDTPIHLALDQNYVSAVEQIAMYYKCDLNIKNNIKKTPRHYLKKSPTWKQVYATIKYNLINNYSYKEYLTTNTKKVKFLILGASGVGKTTLFKNITIIYNGGYTDEQLMSYKLKIYYMVLKTMYSCIRYCIEKKMKLNNEEVAKKILKIKLEEFKESDLTDEIHDMLITLWKEKSIQEAFLMHHHEFPQTPESIDNAKHLLDNLVLMKPKSYLPFHDDILHCDVCTEQPQEQEFVHEGYTFRVIDTGGQRFIRPEGYEHYWNVNLLIFVASLNDYYQVCGEDGKTNRLQESINYFIKVANSIWFKDIPIVLFLNKSDLFKKSIQRIKLQQYFPDFYGGTDFQKAVKFIEQKFLEKVIITKRVTTICINCTDTSQVKLVTDRIITAFVD